MIPTLSILSLGLLGNPASQTKAPAKACTFEAGFHKGVKDNEIGSVGANPDQFCSQGTEKEVQEFRSGYDQGQENGRNWRELKIEKTPATSAEIIPLLSDARKKAQDAQVIQELENKNKRMKEEVSRIRERLDKQEKQYQKQQR